MLSKEDNELLTKIGPGSAMGEMLREYWIPVLMSSELPERDGPPLRVRLLGEDLIAFRTTSGVIGLMDQACPHRTASLYFGRNEEDGIRCVYHGWKFNVHGHCVDMPNEVPDKRFHHKIRVNAYTCQERNGIVWAYMGKRSKPPPLPDFEWNTDPENEPFFWRNYRACNWVQALEGDVDSSHLNYLHRSLDEEDRWTVPGKPLPGFTEAQLPLLDTDRSPELEVSDTEYGAVYGAKRRLDNNLAYWRIRPFLFPFHTMVGGGIDDSSVCYSGKAWIPMDDEQTLVLEWRYRPGRPWSQEERKQLLQNRIPWGFAEPTTEPAGAWKPKAHAGNDYFLDRDLEREKLFCGIISSPLQDAAVQESMGPISDRTREHLGPSDAMIIRVRRRLLQAAKDLRDRGTVPPGVDEPCIYRVRPVAAIIPTDADWLEMTRRRRLETA